MRITDLTDDGRLRDDGLCSADPAQVNGYELRHGDLLFARSGATVGKSYLYHEIDGPMRIRWLSDSVPTSVRERVLPEFLELITHSQPYYRWVGSMFRAGAQPNINAAEYASMMCYLPPLLEQCGRLLPCYKACAARLMERGRKEIKRGRYDSQSAINC